MNALSKYKDTDKLILQQLEDEDLASICQGNKYFRDICNDNTFWKNRFFIKFGNSDNPDKPWKEYYFEIKKELRTPNKFLIDSSKKGKLDLVKIALNNGGNIDAQDNFGKTPFIWASENGHIEIVKYLVENGVDIHAQDDWALMEASGGGHLPVVKYLVSQGANIHAQDDLAFIWASDNGHLPVVKYLYSKGANIHADDDLALKRASINKHFPVINYLKFLN